MSHSQAEIDSEGFAPIKKIDGDEYPIIWYSPEIETEAKKNLKDFIQGHRLIHSFRCYFEVLEFAKSLGISFILIIPFDFNEQRLFQDLNSLEQTYGRRMSKFEEEKLLEGFIKETSDETIKATKVYVFCTLGDCLTKTGPKSEEKDVTVMGKLDDMIHKFEPDPVIIIYDANMNSEIKERLACKIGFPIEVKNSFTSLMELRQIRSHTDPPFHLIIAGQNLEERAIDELIELNGLLGLYIYGEEIALDCKDKKKVTVGRTPEEITSKISDGIRNRSKFLNILPAFAASFDTWDRSHLYYLHYYLKAFVNFSDREQAKEDFIKLAQNISQDWRALSRFQLEYNEYDKGKIFNWYTKDSPIYRLVNNCLRIASSDSILYCRFVLKDLEQAIREQYREQSHIFNGLVFRGAHISDDEWEKLERNIGQEIEMYGFLSTTMDPKVAIKFISGYPNNKILITIIIPPLPELDDQGFASINEFAELKDEKEILFNVRSKFQILKVGIVRIKDYGESRHLVLLFGAQLLREYMTKNQPLINIKLELPAQEIIQCMECGSVSNLFGFQQDTTQIRCLSCLVRNSVPKDIPIIPLDGKSDKFIEMNFKGKMLKFTQKVVSFSFSGYICCDCQKNRKNVEYYKWITQDGKELIQCSKCFEERKEMKSHILVSESFPFTLWTEGQEEWERTNRRYGVELSRKGRKLNEGEVYLEVQDFNRCIKYGNQVLDSLKSKRCREGEKARTFEMRGRAYENLGKYSEALESHLNALEIRKILSEENPAEMISSYHSLASTYQSLGQYQKALNYQILALDLAKEAHGQLQPEIATSYHNIASTYQRIEESEKALEYQLKALEIRSAVYGESHPETAKSYNNLALMYASFKEHNKSLEYHNKALNILTSIFGKRHPHVASLYNNIALVYRNKNENAEAIKWNKEALVIVKSIYGENHPRIGISYSNIASTYERMGKDVAALDYHLKALETLKEFYDKNSPEMIAVYNSVILGYKNLRRFDKAAEYEAILKENRIQKDLKDSSKV